MVNIEKTHPADQDAFHDGFKCCFNGFSFDSNPYDESDPLHDEWAEGWIVADGEPID